jgi:hypothetical protein
MRFFVPHLMGPDEDMGGSGPVQVKPFHHHEVHLSISVSVGLTQAKCFTENKIKFA